MQLSRQTIYLTLGFFLLCLPCPASALRIVAAATCLRVVEPGTTPVGIADRFESETPEIHAVVTLAEVKAGTRIKGTWVSVDAIATPDFVIDTSEMEIHKEGDAGAHFSVSKPESGWPAGHYRLDVFIDGKPATILPFSIGAASGSTPPNATPPSADTQNPSQPQEAAATLLGNWQCQSQQGIIELVFLSQDRLTFGGDPAAYVLGASSIRVQTDEGLLEYPYTLQGDSLLLTFPQGFQLQCRRSTAASGAQTAAGAGQLGTAGTFSGQYGATAASGEEHLLQGRFCHWSGSSGGGSSYSSSKWASFDGRGNFVYGSESSFSSDAGQAFGQNGNPDNRGTYRVQGNSIYLSFADGSSDVAGVYYRQANGTITELRYQGEIYAAAMCQ